MPSADPFLASLFSRRSIDAAPALALAAMLSSGCAQSAREYALEDHGAGNHSVGGSTSTGGAGRAPAAGGSAAGNASAGERAMGGMRGSAGASSESGAPNGYAAATGTGGSNGTANNDGGASGLAGNGSGAVVGSCTPGVRRCDGRQPQRCSDGAEWVDEGAQCPQTCESGVCVGTCASGATQCASSTVVQTCSANGQWNAGTACTNACVMGACSGVCRPKDRRCAQDGTTLETCSESGQWQPSACPGACVGDACSGTCKPGAKECVAGPAPQYRVCNDSGEWAQPVVCELDPACVKGECRSDPKLAFVTSTVYTGNLGGLSGADAKCQARADAAGLRGTFKAWISDDTGSPSTRFSFAGGPILLVDGSGLANNWKELRANGVARLLSLTELGQTPTMAKPPPNETTVPCEGETRAFVWTDTKNDGTLAAADRNCSNWTSTAARTLRVGRWDDVKYWSGYCTVNGRDAQDDDNCAMQAALYCFQQ